MKTKVGSPRFDDPKTRYAVAIPSAVVITVLGFMLGRWQPALRPPETPPPAATIVLERRPPTPVPTPAPTPRPTPRPTPTPPPPRPVPHVTIAPVPQRAAPDARRTPGGGHAAPIAVVHVPRPTVVAGGSGGGAGTGTGEGADAGTGGGTGNGTGGSGTGTVNADAPCGSVDLIPYKAPDRRGNVTYEYVQATVTFPDGHTESDVFPYRWAYGDPASDPWSPRNLPDPNFDTRVQLPPPGTDESRYPDIIRYILDHTRSDGTTVLQECPRTR